MTAGYDLDRVQRMRLVREAEVRAGLRPPETKAGDIDLSGAYYEGGGEIGLRPVYFDMPGQDNNEKQERVSRARSSGRGDSATFALLESFSRAYREPSLFVWRGPWMDIERSERLDGHPATMAGGILRHPNSMARITMTQLQAATAKGRLAGGDFYWVKARTGGGSVTTNTTGAVARLWPVWSNRMAPAVYSKNDPRESNGWIDYYAYQVGRGKPVEVPPENVVHFRNGLHDADPRRGVGVVEEFALEVASDIEAALLLSAVYQNLGIPGLVFAPEAPSTGAGGVAGGMLGIPKDDREQIKASVMARTTGNRRGEPIVLSRPTRFEQFQIDLSQYDLDHVWSHVETRMSGVVGWPAILAGLQAGLDAATYANVASLRRFATENAVVPTWIDDAEAMTLALGPDLGLRPDEYIAYDYRTVRAMQEDIQDLWERVGKEWQNNSLTIGEHHRLLDLELPPGVDPEARRVDVEASAQLRGLLGPAMGKGVSFLVDGNRAQPQPLLLDGGTKAANVFGEPAGWTPEDTNYLAAEELGAIPDDDEVEAALALIAGRIAEAEEEMAGILGADLYDEPADDEEKAGPDRLTKDRPPTSWVFDEAKQRYRWPTTGRLVPEQRVFDLRERLISKSKTEMRQAAQDHLDGKTTLTGMQRRMRKEYGANQIGMRSLAVGGDNRLTRADRVDIGVRIAKENGFLAGFAGRIARGEMSEAEILANAELYAGGGYRDSFAAGRLDRHRTRGYGYKSRSIRSKAPCTTCKDEAAMGRVPIDTPGFQIGGTDCRSNDMCEILFHRGDEGE